MRFCNGGLSNIYNKVHAEKKTWIVLHGRIASIIIGLGSRNFREKIPIYRDFPDKTNLSFKQRVTDVSRKNACVFLLLWYTSISSDPA